MTIVAPRVALPRLLAFFLAIQGVEATFGTAAHADDAARVTILEENDSIYFNSDKHYTQGLRASDLGPMVAPASNWNLPFDFPASLLPIFAIPSAATGQAAPETTRRYSVLFGQSIFTPKNLTLSPPDPRDRPYGGWLYVGASLLQETSRDMLENLELDAGVVGPGALGKQVQNDFHQLIGDAQAQGWSHQIQNEPGVTLSYQRLWRLPLASVGDIGADVVPQVGATIGNVFTYGAMGGMVRIGHNLQADYGAVRVRPGLSGTDYFDARHLDGNLGYYFYIGTEGRVVGRNIFLDGNSFRQSPNVQKRTLVADFDAGFTVFSTQAWRVDFSAGRRTREFIGQQASDVMGTAALTVGF